MINDHVLALSRTRRAFLIAPAGCGKTETIAKAVNYLDSQRELILTHTHAGVHAILSRLRKLGVPSYKYKVDTIASWSLDYVSSFPKLSGFSVTIPDDDQWEDIYKGAATLLKQKPIRQMIHDSYSGVFVDEYQDCTKSQHDIVMLLSEVLPCRILGDPLQSIFGFKNSTLVDWNSDIAPNFDKLPEMDTPWRWTNKDREDLGKWLLKLREPLLKNSPIDLSKAPLAWYTQNPANQRNICYKTGKNGSSVVIHKWPNGSHSFSRSIGGFFTSMEEIFCRDLLDGAEAIESATGLQRAATIIEFASKCLTSVSTELKTIITCCEKNDSTRLNKQRRYPNLVKSIFAVSNSEHLSLALPLMKEIETLPNAKPFRHELWEEMKKTIANMETGKSARETAWGIRSRGRHSGRRTQARTSSRTLLIKGLEFDHAIVVDADKLTRNELYVALTRGSMSLTVLSQTKTLMPKCLP